MSIGRREENEWLRNEGRRWRMEYHAAAAKLEDAIAERDRLRRELEEWRDNAQSHALTGDLYAALSVADRIDDILNDK